MNTNKLVRIVNYVEIDSSDNIYSVAHSYVIYSIVNIDRS